MPRVLIIVVTSDGGEVRWRISLLNVIDGIKVEAVVAIANCIP
jgi:hypothetical protein